MPVKSSANRQAKAGVFAKSGLTFFADTGRTVGIEAVEDTLQGFFGNAGTFIFYRDPDDFAVPDAE